MSTELQIFSNTNDFKTAQDICKAFTTSNIVPSQYQGGNNMGNCLIALEISHRMGVSVLAVMQSLDVIRGRPSWSAKFIISIINQSNIFKSRLKFEMIGDEGTDDRACFAYAIDQDGEIVKGPKVSITMAKKDGWYDKTGSKWKTMPELMLQYRAASFFGKVHVPELLMGLQSQEEVADITTDDNVIEGDAVEILKDKLRIQDNPEQAF